MNFKKPFKSEMFVGEGKRLDAIDVPIMAHRLGVDEDHLRAFLEVEARSQGFDSKGRPIMLFEPHVFYRNLPADKRDAAVKAGLAYPNWGQKPYPKDSYPRLLKAMEIDHDAALKSASIGLSQVLVENYQMVGYQSPAEMWRDFMADEENHVEAMVNYILATGIADDLNAERWDVVARVYNGPSYRKHNYHGRMAQAFARFSKEPDMQIDASTPAEEATFDIPDAETLRAVQSKLRELGYTEVGKVDGAWGTRTRAAVLAFRYDHGMPLTAEIDDDFLAALMVGRKRDIGEARASTTAKDLRDAGSRTVAAADKTEGVGILGGILGALGVAAEADWLTLPDAIETLKPIIDTLSGFSPVVLVVAGVFILLQQRQIKNARVADEREGLHVGRG